MIITKRSLENHFEKLSMVFTRLQDAGLKINADKSNFCTLEMEYLGYMLTRDGIGNSVMYAFELDDFWAILFQE